MTKKIPFGNDKEESVGATVSEGGSQGWIEVDLGDGLSRSDREGPFFVAESAHGRALVRRTFCRDSCVKMERAKRQTGGVSKMRCKHLELVKGRKVHAKTDGCEECLKTGQRWVHLRLCLECGHVGCCDSSIGRHATKHFHATKHAVMRSIEPGESWGWCYVDEEMLELG